MKIPEETCQRSEKGRNYFGNFWNICEFFIRRSSISSTTPSPQKKIENNYPAELKSPDAE